LKNRFAGAGDHTGPSAFPKSLSADAYIGPFANVVFLQTKSEKPGLFPRGDVPQSPPTITKKQIFLHNPKGFCILVRAKRRVDMIRYVKQMGFRVRDIIHVQDEAGILRYYAEEHAPSWRKKLVVYDPDSKPVAFIQVKGFILRPYYSVVVNGTEVARIKKNFQMLGRQFEFLDWAWDVDCSPYGYEYDVSFNGTPVIFVNKKLISWGDYYRVEIDESLDELVGVAIVLAVDCACFDSRRSIYY